MKHIKFPVKSFGRVKVLGLKAGSRTFYAIKIGRKFITQDYWGSPYTIEGKRYALSQAKSLGKTDKEIQGLKSRLRRLK